jgi:hypothetical protein
VFSYVAKLTIPGRARCIERCPAGSGRGGWKRAVFRNHQKRFPAGLKKKRHLADRLLHKSKQSARSMSTGVELPGKTAPHLVYVD